MTAKAAGGSEIRLEDVTCRFGTRMALSGLSLRLSERRIGVIGRNGSGKTTLARLIAGLIPPDSGTVRVCGANLHSDRGTAIRTVGILFQNPDHQIIFPTVEEELAFGLRQLGHAKSAARSGARAMLARFGREAWHDRPVDSLSQGQRHLVCLMSVLAMEPAVIVLDEPFSGLDIPTTRALRGHLEALPATLIHVTHDTEALMGYERVIWLDRGRVAGDGAAPEILGQYLAAMENAPDADTDL